MRPESTRFPARACQGQTPRDDGDAAADDEVGVGVEQQAHHRRELGGVEGAVGVDHGDHVGARRLQAGVHGGAVALAGLPDDEGTEALGELGGAVGRAVVADDRVEPLGQGGEDPRQRFDLVETGQHHVHATIHPVTL